MTPRRWTLAFLTVSVVAALRPAQASGQPRPPRPPRTVEWRLDALAGRHVAAEAGGLFSVPAGPYARVGLGAATGAVYRDGETASVTRVDLIARTLFDPFRETRRGLSLGGGVSLTNVADGRWRPYLTVVLDVEGQRRGRYAPAVQVGLGGGVRLGVALRSAAPRWR